MADRRICRKRLQSLLARMTAIGMAGICYAIWVRQTGMAIPCPFYTIVGLKCPGCGMTRMCAALLQLDFAAAFHYNQVMFLLLPLFGIMFCMAAAAYVKTGKWEVGHIQSHILYACIIALAAFGVIRNILPL